jgi:hypothetical protein
MNLGGRSFVINQNHSKMNLQQKKLLSDLLSQDKCTRGCDERKWVTVRMNRVPIKVRTFKK